jgi:hypothetical protein
LITQIFGEAYKHRVPRYCSLLHSPVTCRSWAQISSSVSYSRRNRIFRALPKFSWSQPTSTMQPRLDYYNLRVSDEWVWSCMLPERWQYPPNCRCG